MSLDDVNVLDKAPTLPGDPNAELIREWGYRGDDVLSLAKTARRHGKLEVEHREGLHHEKADRESPGDDENQSNEYVFTPRMITAAIIKSELYFVSDDVFKGARPETIHNAAVVSVGIGTILAPLIAEPGTDPEEALRQGTLRGQEAVDGCKGRNKFMDHLAHGNVDATDEQQLFVAIGEGGKISDADRKKLQDFLVKNGAAVVVVTPSGSHTVGGPQNATGIMMGIFTQVERAKEHAKQYAWHLLRKIGADGTPSPENGPKPMGGKKLEADQKSGLPPLNLPAPPTS